MGKIRVFRNWRNYKKEDWRIEAYCKKECAYCLIKKDNGQAFCYGQFRRIKDEALFRGNGAECTKTVKICFSNEFKLIER